jgi:Xaa-Pro dipeptidase
MHKATDESAAGALLPFARQEFTGRRDQLVELLKQRKIDLALITSPANYFYLTGLASNVTSYLFALALQPNGRGLWIGRRMEMSNVVALAPECWATERVPIDDSEDAIARLAEAASAIAGPGATVGIEFASPQLSMGDFARLRAAVPAMQFVDFSGTVESMRTVKSAAELDYLRAAGAIVGKAMAATLRNLRYGARDSDLAAALIAAAIQGGSEPMAEGPYVTSGPRSFRAHSSWTHAVIGRGEAINTEMAAARAHYHTPVFRMSVFGAPGDELRRLHDASAAGLRAGLEKIEAGMTSAQADAVVRQRIEKAGCGEFFTVRAAYGIGLGFPPGWGENSIMSIRPGDERRLRPGMCFHMVPALYKPGLGAVCCSMPFHIGARGIEPLTQIEPDLFILDC